MIMYSDIQADKSYTRIYNYESSTLLCHNMVLGILIGMYSICEGHFLS